MAVLCSYLMSCFPGMLLGYFLKDFDISASSYHYYYCHPYFRPDNTFSLMNRLRHGRSQYQGFFASGSTEELPSPQRPDGAHTLSHKYGKLYLQGQSGRRVKRINHLHLLPKLMLVVIPSIPNRSSRSDVFTTNFSL
jgi:hypothetical protein